MAAHAAADGARAHLPVPPQERQHHDDEGDDEEESSGSDDELGRPIRVSKSFSGRGTHLFKRPSEAGEETPGASDKQQPQPPQQQKVDCLDAHCTR